jgi:hypothetical protein
MKRRTLLWSGLGACAFLLMIGGGWIFSLPGAPGPPAPPPIAKEEAEAMIAALRPPKRQRPLIAIIGANGGTEATDYLMPYGILRRADVADVVALGGAATRKSDHALDAIAARYGMPTADVVAMQLEYPTQMSPQ